VKPFFARWGFVLFYLPHGLRRRVHSYAATRLDGCPVLHRSTLSSNYFYSSPGLAALKNRMEAAMVAQSGAVYLMIRGVPRHLPGWQKQRLKPGLILLCLRHG